MKWVKSSDRLPVKEGTYIVKEMYTDNVSKRFFTGTVFENYQGYRVTEWLDESETTDSTWVSVEERLPDRGERVLMITNSGSYLIAYLNENAHWRLMTGVEPNPMLQKATHWQPLPSPPKNT